MSDKKDEGLQEVAGVWSIEGYVGISNPVDQLDGDRLLVATNELKKTDEAPTFRLFRVTEVGGLWAKTSKKGTDYFSGPMSEALGGFISMFESTSDHEKAPDLRITVSAPQDEAPKKRKF